MNENQKLFKKLVNNYLRTNIESFEELKDLAKTFNDKEMLLLINQIEKGISKEVEIRSPQIISTPIEVNCPSCKRTIAEFSRDREVIQNGMVHCYLCGQKLTFPKNIRNISK